MLLPISKLDYSKVCLDEYPPKMYEDPTTLPHGHGPTDEDHLTAVQDLAKRLRGGQPIVPIEVMKAPEGHPKDWLVMDGHHRTYASHLAGFTYIDADEVFF